MQMYYYVPGSLGLSSELLPAIAGLTRSREQWWGDDYNTTPEWDKRNL